MTMPSVPQNLGPQKAPGAKEGRTVGSSSFFLLVLQLLLFLPLQTGLLLRTHMTDSSCLCAPEPTSVLFEGAAGWNRNLLVQMLVVFLQCSAEIASGLPSKDCPGQTLLSF